jgi:hypothetical protein
MKERRVEKEAADYTGLSGKVRGSHAKPGQPVFLTA